MGAKCVASVYEAEASENKQYHTKIIDNPYCESGKCVSRIGHSSHLRFNGITVESDNTYRLTISYLTDEIRFMTISINDFYTIEKVFRDTTTDKPKTISFEVLLNAGSNTIKMFNKGGPAPDIDYVMVENLNGPEIKLTNIVNNEHISYSYLILRGKVEKYSRSDVKISVNNGEEFSWPVHYSKRLFKAVVKLNKGCNIIKIRYAEHKTKYLAVRYTEKTNGPSVRFIYMLPEDDCMGRFRAPEGVSNVLLNARRRYAQIALLLQSMFAELMNNNGFGRQTFRIYTVENISTEIVHMVYANETLNDLKAYNYRSREENIYDKFYDYINSMLVRDEKHLMDVVMFGSSYYTVYYGADGITEKHTYMDTVKSRPGMVLTGSSTLYSVPERYENIRAALYDTTKGYMLDGQFWESFQDLIAVFIRELGYAFGLKHCHDSNINGILGVQFNQIMHLLAIRKPNGREFNFEIEDEYAKYMCFDEDEEDDCFHDADEEGAALSASLWFSDKPYLKREAQSDENTLFGYGKITPVIKSNSLCSGKKYVTDLVYGSKIIFNNIIEETEGYYNIDVYYLSCEKRYLYAASNDEYIYDRMVSFPALESEDEVGVVTIENIHLNKGANSITFSAHRIPSECAPDIDKIEIYFVSKEMPY